MGLHLVFATFLCLGTATACGSIPKPKQLPDGSLSIECEGEISPCVRRAESFCGGDPMEIIEATSREGQHGSGRYPEGSRVASVRFVCGKSQAWDLNFLKKKNRDDSSAAPADPAAPAAAKPTMPVEPDLACTPGATQECTGPGACAGGQSCLPDGSAWGRCDCGDGQGRGTTGTAQPPGDASTDDSAPEPSSDADGDQ